MRSALETVGFSVAFAYEKIREKWIFQNFSICMDQLPFGRFVEVEGVEGGIEECARLLGLEGNETTKLTYHALNLAYREKNGLPSDESFVFEKEEKRRILAELGKV